MKWEDVKKLVVDQWASEKEASKIKINLINL